jgi:hypothetical protein
MASEPTLSEQWRETFEKLQRNDYLGRDEQLALQQKLQDITRQQVESDRKAAAVAAEAEQARGARSRRIGELTHQMLEGKPEERTAARAELDRMSAEEQAKQSTP